MWVVSKWLNYFDILLLEVSKVSMIDSKEVVVAGKDKSSFISYHPLIRSEEV